MTDTGSWDCLLFGCEVTSDWKARALELNQLDDGQVGIDFFRMRGHFRLEGTLELNQLDDGQKGLELSYVGCEVTSGWKARWNLK